MKRYARAGSLSSGATRDDVQGAALALGTGSVERGPLAFCQQRARIRSRGAEMKPAQGERLSAVAVGKQSEVADLDETGRQLMEQEAADELYRVEGHDAAAVAMAGVPPPEAHLSVIEAEEPSVGDGNPMRVAGQVLQRAVRMSRMGRSSSGLAVACSLASETCR